MTTSVTDDRTALELAAQARKAALGGGSETRSAAPRETGHARLVPAQAQLRAQLVTRGDQEMFHLDGIASVTDRGYRMFDAFGEYDEIVNRDAFTKTLAAKPDVAFLLNHRGMTMARTTNDTLRLSMTGDGLRSEAWLNPKRQDVKDLVVAIEDGNITEMSFAFMLERGEWSDDFSEFRITQLDINRGDVSAVNYGANPYTSIAARSREILSDLDHMPHGLARAALDRLAARDDLRAPAPPAGAPETPADNGGPSIAFYEALLNLT